MSIYNSSALIRRTFVSASRPSYRAAKVDKETCAKVVEAAETVKDGTQEVVNEVKRATQTITKTVSSVAGNVAADAVHKGLEKASEKAGSGKSKDILETVKSAAEVMKDKAKDK